jgi:hypothetical protein
MPNLNFKEIEEALESLEGFKKVSPLWERVLPQLRHLISASKGLVYMTDSGLPPQSYKDTSLDKMPIKVADRILAVLKERKEPLKSGQILGLFRAKGWIDEDEADLRRKIQNQLIYLSQKKNLLEGDGKKGYYVR